QLTKHRYILNVSRDGSCDYTTKKTLQLQFKTTAVGVISGQPSNKSVRNIPSAKIYKGGSDVVKALQKFVGTEQDRIISNPSAMVRALQKRFKTTQDGHVSNPSLMVKEMQRRLNNGKL